MNTKRFLLVSALALALTLLVTQSFASGSKSGGQAKQNKLSKATLSQVDFVPNTIEAFLNNNGVYFENLSAGNDGLFWPAHSGKNAVFSAGPWLMGRSAQDHLLHSASSDYNSEYQPGPIVTTYDGDPNNAPSDAANASDSRWDLMVLSKFASPSDPAYQSWVNNASQTGAPLNKDGTPQLLGDLNAYWVMNDLFLPGHMTLSTANPMGVEVHNYVFGFNKTGPIGQTLFMKLTFINKSTVEYDSCFVAWFSDIDLGDANDDLDGCDTVLSLGYTYNGGPSDAVYGIPPADGYDFSEGPKVPTGNQTDSAIANGVWRHGYKNLPMTSFAKFINSPAGSTYSDPPLGNPQWPAQAYNLLNGSIGSTGQPFLDNNSHPSKFVDSGDPSTGSGWLDANPGDRRLVMASGPFKLMPGDTQEILVAFVIAQGTSNTNSVTLLKANDLKVKSFIDGQPVASIEAVNSIYPLDSVVNFHGSSAVYSGSITGTQWFVAQKPNSSSASLVVASPTESHMQVDVSGVYKIGYAVTGSNGGSDTAYVAFQVVADTPPVAGFQTSATNIGIGDTLYLDGSASYDADGDSLKYAWTVSGNNIFDQLVSYDALHGVLTGASSAKAAYVPVRASTLNISLSVQDSFFTNAAPVQNAVVNPIKTKNVQVSASYNTFYIPGGEYYAHGAIRKFRDNSVWAQDDGVYFPLNFTNLAQVSQSYVGLPYSNNFYVSNNLLFVPNNYVGVSVCQTDGNSNILGTAIIPPIQVNTTSDSIPYDVYYKSPYLFVSNGTAGIYLYDISNPASPVFYKKLSNGQKWTALWVDGNYLFSMNSSTQQLTYAYIFTPSAVIMASTQVNHAYTAVKKLGQYFYLSKADTIGIYDLSNLSNPVLKSEIAVPYTLNSANVIYDISGDGTTLMIGTAEGVYFYDVSNVQAPRQIGKFITGYEATRVYYDGSEVLANSFGRGLSGGYEGFTVFQPTITGVVVSPDGTVPSHYALRQNYPNPFNPTTTINYQLPSSSHVTLKVYDVLGRELVTLANENKTAGVYQTTFDGSRFSSGVYFYRIQAGDFTSTKKFTLMK